MKRSKLLFGTFLATAAVAVGALPSVLSTEWGRATVVNLANKTMKEKLEVGDLTLSWTGPQRIHELRVTHEGKETLAIQELTTEASLFNLAFGGRNLGKTRVLHPRAHIAEAAPTQGGTTKALPKREPKPLELPFTGDIEIEAGEVTIEREGHAPVTISDLNAQITANQLSGPVTGSLSGTTRQNGLLGKIQMKGEVAGFDEQGRLAIQIGGDGLPRLSEQARVNLDVDVTRLPLATLSGPLAEALGEAIDIQIQNRLDPEGLLINGIVNAPNLQAQINGRTSEGRFELTQAAAASVTLTPKFLQSYSPGMQFNRPVNGELTIDTLTFPLDLATMSFDLSSLQMLATLALEDLAVIADEKSGLIELVNVRSRLEVKEPGAPLQVNGAADLYHNHQSGKLSLNAELAHLFEETGPFAAKFTSSGSSLPVGLLDRLAGLDGMIADALGERMEFEAKGELSEKAADLLFSLDTPTTTIRDLHLVKDERIRLSSDNALQLSLPRSFTQRYFPPELEIELPELIPLAISITRFDFPAGEFSPRDSHVDLYATLQDVTFGNLPNVGGVRMLNGLLSLKGTLDQATLQQGIDMEILDRTTAVGASLGETLEVRGEGVLYVKPDKRMDLLQMSGSVKGENSSLLVKGKLIDRSSLTLSSSEISHRVTPAAYRVLSGAMDDATLLLEPATVKLALDPLQLELDEIDPSALYLRGRANVDKFVVGKRDSVTAAMRDGQFDWELDMRQGTFQSKLAGTTLAEGERGALKGNVAFSGWRQNDTFDFSGASSQADLTFNRFPVPFLEALTGYQSLDLLVGNTLELTLKSTINNMADPTGSMALRMEGKDFLADADLVFDEGMSLRPGKQASVDWRISPSRFDALRTLADSQHPIKLLKTANVKLAVSALSFPWGDNLYNGAAQADIEVSVDELRLHDERHNQTTTFEKFKARVKGRDLFQLLDFSLSGDGTIGGSTPVKLSVNGQLGEPLSPGGGINWLGMSKQFDATATNIPASLVADSFGIGRDLADQVKALFGDRVDFEASAKIRRGTGPFTAKLTAEHSRFNMDAYLTDNTLSLQSPLTGELDVTPELSKAVLKNINPLLVTAIKGEQPVKITVEPHGVRVPMTSWDTSELQVGKATVEVGKVTLTNGGPLALIIGILQSGGLSGRDNMQAWFTPQYLNVNNGVVTAERMDFLIADSIHMATWGNLNLPRNEVKMTLGIPSHTLRQNFGIKGMPRDHMMQVPIKGTLDDPNINVAKAVARIAAMRTAQSSGDQGKILGGIFGLIGGGGGITDGPAPPPTTNPLPWPIPEYEDEVVEEEDEPVEERRSPVDLPGPLEDIFDIFRKKK